MSKLPKELWITFGAVTATKFSANKGLLASERPFHLTQKFVSSIQNNITNFWTVLMQKLTRNSKR